MGKIIILGSAAAVPTAEQENTHLAVQDGDQVVLVDCPGNPLRRLAQAAVDWSSLNNLILTHFHPDHVGGFVQLLMGMWLLGRKSELTVHGLQDTLTRAQAMLDLYDWRGWPGFFPVRFNNLPAVEGVTVVDTPNLRVSASPVKHLIPTIGLRFEFAGGKTAAYSCDSEPCERVRKLAAGVDLLLHEASGEHPGHSSAAQAGEVASLSGAKRLMLIHYDVRIEDLLRQAASAFAGPVSAACDLLTVEI